MRFLVVALALLVAPAAAQSVLPPDGLPFTVELVEREYGALPALHSFASAEHDGLRLLVTGRTDGLHGFGEDPFPNAYATTRFWVIDPATGEAWNAPMDELPEALRESLRVTNAQYAQRGETLYVVGGYGHHTPSGTMITFPTLTAFDVPGLIEAVRLGTPLAPHVRQVEDDRLRITGGEMRRLGDRFYLFGGNRFDGEYSGPGSEFFQAYTHAVVAFGISNEPLALTDYEVLFEHETHLRRRDLTVAPIVEPDGRLGFGMYAGVFQQHIDWPHRSPIYILDDDEGRSMELDGAFEQTFAHYTAPALALFDAASGDRFTTLFGGMSLFFVNDAGQVQMDGLVPFTREVVTVARTADGTTTEHLLDPMPGRLGTNMAFFRNPALPWTAHGALPLGALDGRTHVGWLFGGLEANAPNPGRLPHTGSSWATRRLFELHVAPRGSSAEAPPATTLALEGPYPNPTAASATVALVLDRAEVVRVSVYDALGRRVAVLHDGLLEAQRRHAFTLDASGLPSGSYFVRVEGETVRAARAFARVR